MENRDEKIRTMNANLREFMNVKLEEDRLKLLFVLNNEEIKFLCNFEPFNVDRNYKNTFLEGKYEGFEYVISIAHGMSNAFVLCKDLNGMNDLFAKNEQKLLLFAYLNESGVLRAMDKISAQKINIDAYMVQLNE